MKNIPQRTLQYNIGLVKYENPKQRDEFDLTTIHSLLIDQNPKFIQLRQLILNYNSSESKGLVNRPHLQRPFIERLYKMLSELTRIPLSQNQNAFLNKIYAWAFQEPDENQDLNFDYSNDKMRPSTGTTRTRPYSAANTRKSRPDSAIPSKPSINSKKSPEMGTISKKIMDNYPMVDFKQLKHGEQQFFLGHRTIHPQQQRPKIKLKQYQRKVFYDEPDDEGDKRIVSEHKKPTAKKPKLIQVPLEESLPVEEEVKIEQGEAGQMDDGGGVDEPAVGEQEANIDDIVAGEEGEPAAQQEQVEVVDKLKPRIKPYGNSLQPISDENIQDYYRGLKRQQYERQKKVRQAQEQKTLQDMMKVWAATKNRVKIQQRRRAESARIMTRNTGMQFEKYVKKQQKNAQAPITIDFSQPNTVQVKSKTRPLSAFKPQSKRVQNQTISNAISTGKLSGHVNIKVQENNFMLQKAQPFTKMGTFAEKPKKKTFQQILREAEQKVCKDTQDQIEQVKQKLTMNKIALGANKIYKSLSHHEPEVYDGDFVGLITGQQMYKNPFFKVAKKKKKKKKK